MKFIWVGCILFSFVGWVFAGLMLRVVVIGRASLLMVSDFGLVCKCCELGWFILVFRVLAVVDYMLVQTEGCGLVAI